MSSYIDLKYINEISARLSQFKKKGDYLYNFRCPHCGDSKKSKTKARAYFYRVKNESRKLIKKFDYSGIEWRPKNKVSLKKDDEKKLINLLEILEEDDDIQNVYSNAEFTK